MGRAMRVVLRIHGVSMGWICLHHESVALARFRVDLYGSLQSEALRQLYNVVCSRHVGEHAGSLCRVPTDPKQ